MARQPMTPSAPAKRVKNTANPEAAAKAKTRRKNTAAAPAEMPSKTMPGKSASSGVQQQTFEKPAAHAEAPHAAQAPDAGREDRASRALDAIKTLGDMIAEGIGALGELRTEVHRMSGRLDQLAASQSNAGQQAGAEDYAFGRDRDPGDAVPPGVAVTSPTPLTETDEAALQSLEEMPKRAGRAVKRAPRAKA